MNPATQHRFDRWAPAYDAGQLQAILYHPVHQVVLDHAAHRAPNAHAILDIGCGTGQLLSHAAHMFPRSRHVGVDVSAAMIHQATRRSTPSADGPAVTIVRAAAEQLPFRDGTFDLLLSTLSLRHWGDRQRALAEIRRVAAPNAVFVVADALDRPPHSRTTRRTPRRTRVSPLKELLTASGFEVEQTKPVPRASLLADVVLLVATAV